MKRPVVLPYSRKSMAARTVSRHFGTLRIFPDRKYRPRQEDIVVNWGFCNHVPVLEGKSTRILNPPEAVSNASSKVSCLTILQKDGIPVPNFATTRNGAEELLKTSKKLYCRTLTRASKGKGIVLVNKASELVKAPLYTAQLDTDIEYRVHVFGNKILDVVQKRKMTKERMADKGITDFNKDVRNLMNGWSFTRGNLTLANEEGEYYHQMIDICLETVKSLKLDFCAIDLVKSKADDFYVLEVNTAPGMKAGTTTHRRYMKSIAEVCEIPFNDAEYTKRYGIEDGHNNNLSNFLKAYYDEDEN